MNLTEFDSRQRQEICLFSKAFRPIFPARSAPSRVDIVWLFPWSMKRERWMLVVVLKPRPFYLFGGKPTVSIRLEVGWAPEPVWAMWRIVVSLAGINPDPSAMHPRITAPCVKFLLVHKTFYPVKFDVFTAATMKATVFLHAMLHSLLSMY
jgi:hypothetical protein